MWSINGINYNIADIQKNQVLIDSCAQLGFDIPRFCYHENLKIAGNCRMCLIEDSKSPKPVICCAGVVTQDLSIYTNTIQVKKARESVMEFLLINHPLDCPICDQGGERDLQDLALVYGSDHGRFYDYKRNVEDKNCGPVIKTVMNRCILCTRCVRFATDIAGLNTLGLTGRGGKMEIGSYVEKILDSELSGNLIDVCPVGALTSKPYSFVSRPWELKKLTVLNLFDDQPQLIRVDLKENEIVRILPAKNAKSYNLWITNKARYSYEGLNRNRLISPAVLNLQCSWQTLLNTLKLVFKYVVSQKFQTSNFNSILQSASSTLNFSTLEEVYIFKSLLTKIGFANVLSNQESFKNPIVFLPRTTFFLDSSAYRKYIILGSNVQLELPLTGVLLVKQIISSPTSIVLWRSINAPLLISNTVVINSAVRDLIDLTSGKAWVNQVQSNFLSLFILKPTFIKLYNFIKNTLNKVKLFLITPNISYRGLLEIDLSSIQQNTKELQTISVFSYSASRNTSSIDGNDVSIFKLFHSTHQFTFKDNEFLMPLKTHFEKAGSYYDNDYSILRVVKTVSTDSNIKSLLSLFKVWAYFLNINELVTFTNNVYTNNPFSFSYNKGAEYFFDCSQFYKSRLITRREAYTSSPLLAFSSTLAAIENNSLSINIY